MLVVKMLPVICLWVICLTLTQASSREEDTEDIIERVLGMPNSDKVINSVLGRLERNRQGLLQSANGGINDDCDEAEALAQYTESIENSRERGMRHTIQKHARICQVNRTVHRLNTNEYEYRPAYYEEIRCNISANDDAGHKDQLCSSIGLTCVQWNKTIHLTRRRYSSDCWETKTMIIPSGCECMWPVHKFGAISSYLYVRP